MAGDELVGRPARGRRFEAQVRVRLADVAPTGRLRLDAIARMLQDVSSDDSADSGYAPDAAWVIRRLLIEQRPVRAPRLRDVVTLVTWCSGTGPRWAERRTDLELDGDVVARAGALWVLVDAKTGRPIPLGDTFDAVYGEAAAGRRVGQRLRLGRRSSSGAGSTPAMPWRCSGGSRRLRAPRPSGSGSWSGPTCGRRRSWSSRRRPRCRRRVVAPRMRGWRKT